MRRDARSAGQPAGSLVGHMAFPVADVIRKICPISHALRETEEEIGVDLRQWGTALGELSGMNTGWRRIARNAGDAVIFRSLSSGAYPKP